MKDKSVEDQIKELVKADKLKIVDQANNVIYDQEIKESMGVKRQASNVVTQKEKSAKKGVTISVQGDSESDKTPQLELN